MDKELYKQTRNNQNFLYIYFCEESEIKLKEVEFLEYLGLWMMSMNIHPNAGVAQILNFIDEKFR